MGEIAGQPVLRYGDFGDPATLDPLHARQAVERRIGRLLFDSLVSEEGDGFALSLAKGVDVSPDGLTYTFWLPENMKWGDGEPLTARDVGFSVTSLLESGAAGSLAGHIEKVFCYTPHSVNIALVRPFHNPMSLFTFPIIPRHVRSADKSSPAGCGPFRLRDEAEPGSAFHLEKNPVFRSRRGPFLREVIVRLYSDRGEALQALLSGKIDLVTEVSLRDLPVLVAHADRFAVAKYGGRTVHFIALNHRAGRAHSSLFADVRFRRAITQAVDREKTLDEVFRGNPPRKDAHALLSGPFPPGLWMHDGTVAPLPHDEEQARMLFRQAAAACGLSLEKGSLRAPAGEMRLALKFDSAKPDVEAACRRIAESWERIGFPVTLEPMKTRAFHESVFLEHDFELAYVEHTFDSALDAFPLFDPDQTRRGQSNFSGYVAPWLRELFAEFHDTLSPRSLRAAAHRIHRAAHENAVHVFLWRLDAYAAHHRKLRNFEVHPGILFNFPEKWKIVEE